MLIWGPEQGLPEALKLPADRVHCYMKLFLPGLLLLAVSSYHADGNRTQGELLGSSWSRSAVSDTSESQPGQIYITCSLLGLGPNGG